MDELVFWEVYKHTGNMTETAVSDPPQRCSDHTQYFSSVECDLQEPVLLISVYRQQSIKKHQLHGVDQQILNGKIA